MLITIFIIFILSVLFGGVSTGLYAEALVSILLFSHDPALTLCVMLCSIQFVILLAGLVGLTQPGQSCTRIAGHQSMFWYLWNLFWVQLIFEIVYYFYAPPYWEMVHYQRDVKYFNYVVQLLLLRTLVSVILYLTCAYPRFMGLLKIMDRSISPQHIPKKHASTNAWTSGGKRYFGSTSANFSTVKIEKNQLHFPSNMESNPHPNAERFSIQDTQEYLGTNPETFTGSWNSIHFPPITNRDFNVQVTNAIKSLPRGRAYAVLFTAEGEGRYATLGPSFIITSQSNPEEVISHLKNNHHFAQENSSGTFVDQIICRWRFIGKTNRVVPDIFRAKTPTRKTRSADGTVRRTLALPIPYFSVPQIHREALKRFNDLHEEWKNLQREIAVLQERMRTAPVGTPRFNDYYNQYKAAQRRETKIQIERVTRQEVEGYTGWAVDFASQEKLILEGPNREEMTALKLPGNVFDCNLRVGNQVLHFQDSEIPNAPGDTGTPALRRELYSGALWIRGGQIFKFEDKFASRRLIATGRRNKALDLTKIITADIEALVVKGRTHLPWIAEWYGVNADGSERGGVFNFLDYNRDPTVTLGHFWKDLLLNCRGCTVYFHNWAGYDAFHALNSLVLIAEAQGLTIQPLLHNGKLISIKVCLNNKVILEVKDSLLMLPGALGKLAKSFQVECLKGHSPHYFNPMEHGHPNLDYVGPVPEYKFFEPKRTSVEEWENLVAQFPNKDWNWRENELKYLHADCKALYQVLVKYFTGFKQEFGLSPVKNATVPGLAFKTWKVLQLPAHNLKIEDMSQSLDPAFREGYMGGIVDTYKPHLKNGFYYDVNSLYPSAMLNDLPVGAPILTTLDVHEFVHSDFFGFVRGTVRAPENLSIGLLPLRLQGKLVCPGGTFNGMFFSEELRFALKNGYTLVSIEIAYRFERHPNVFADLIRRLNTMKVQAQEQNQPAKRAIAKLLMNSLYGRFGMHPQSNQVVMANKAEAKIIASAFPITRSIPFTNGHELIEFNPIPYANAVSSGLVEQANVQKYLIEPQRFSETNVPLAAAITAYSRMSINSYKVYCLNNGIGVYYSDTDSLVTDAPLPAEYIHEAELGKLKLEYTILEGFFLAPKLYWMDAINAQGKREIISKSRGYGGEITREQALALYNNTPINVPKPKWTRSWENHQVFTSLDNRLNITGEVSKREKVMDTSGAWVDTKPLIVHQETLKPLSLTPPAWVGYTPDGVMSIQHQLMMAYNKRTSPKTKKKKCA